MSMRKPKTQITALRRNTPVTHVRAIAPLTRLLLFVRAGGRCEFDGCNKDVLRHHVTLTEGIFGQMAHIVAFKVEGPRGKAGRRPVDINDIRNLMLMCPPCHKLVDHHPEKYSRRTLVEYKRVHEKRIRYVTALGPDRGTTVLILKSRIGGEVVQVPSNQIVEATAPRYPISSDPTEIDLSVISDLGTAFLNAAKDEIARRVSRFFEEGGEGHRAQHLSIFALAPMPLLVFFGKQLSNKVPSDLYQRHRDTEGWTWKKRGKPVQYHVRARRSGKRGRVALVLSLSGAIPLTALPQECRDATIYEITLKGAEPRTTFLQTRQDLDGFRMAYQEALGLILKKHGLVSTVDLFPAVPAPIAVLCGRELLPKVHPALRVHDYDKKTGGFTFALEV
jgi:hypothetical protein